MLDPTTEQLEEMAPHIRYELQAQNLALIVWTDYKQHNRDEWVIGLEGFLLHSRVLHEFFFSQERYKDTLRAGDYFDDSSIWITERTKVPQVSKLTWERVNKQLTHLTIKRIHYSEREFNWSPEELQQLHRETQRSYKLFVDSLIPERQAWFRPNDMTDSPTSWRSSPDCRLSRK